MLVFYLLLLGVAVRFIHHALFGGTMLTLQYYVVDTVWSCSSSVSSAIRVTRTAQMVTQYRGFTSEPAR